ncbi:toll/interleukin-1 receptor domain-containing protein [Leptothoe sp. LEGE 181152]|nr:toll/interleukin-1 receptor domain-containing protein [Leptothoe sp. LEGE 181152]
MKIFLSFSGTSSMHVAEALYETLPMILHYAQPWLSRRNISAGTRWGEELSESLQSTSFGILCLTRQSLNSDWVIFEAGALSKFVSEARVVPYLFNLSNNDLGGPLAQFQSKLAEKEATFQVIEAINSGAEEPIDAARLRKQFEVIWPYLEGKLQDIADDSTASEARPTESVIEDLFVYVQDLSRRFSVLEEVINQKSNSTDAKASSDSTNKIKLDSLKEVIRHSERLLSGDSMSPDTVSSALEMAEHCQREIASLLSGEILSAPTRDQAKRLIGRAEALIALAEKKQEDKD